MQSPMKKQPLQVNVNVIKKGPPVDTLISSLFGTTETDMKDKRKGNLSGVVVDC